MKKMNNNQNYDQSPIWEGTFMITEKGLTQEPEKVSFLPSLKRWSERSMKKDVSKAHELVKKCRSENESFKSDLSHMRASWIEEDIHTAELDKTLKLLKRCENAPPKQL